MNTITFKAKETPLGYPIPKKFTRSHFTGNHRHSNAVFFSQSLMRDFNEAIGRNIGSFLQETDTNVSVDKSGFLHVITVTLLR